MSTLAAVESRQRVRRALFERCCLDMQRYSEPRRIRRRMARAMARRLWRKRKS